MKASVTAYGGILAILILTSLAFIGMTGKENIDRAILTQEGDLISFVKVTKEPHVKPVQLASNSEVDVDKYVGHMHSTFAQVLDAMGLDFDEIIVALSADRNEEEIWVRRSRR